MGVAVGRSTHKDGLQIQNFNTIAARFKYPKLVQEFYDSPGRGMIKNKSCCQKLLSIPSAALTHNFQFAVPAMQQSVHHVHLCVEQQCLFDIKELLQNQLLPEVTDIQRNRNATLIDVSKLNSFQNFIHDAYSWIHELLETYKVPPKSNKCNWCIMCAKMQYYLTSDIYVNKMHQTFNVTSLTSIQNKICTKIHFTILAKTLKRNV